jgi:hypothetical protein
MGSGDGRHKGQEARGVYGNELGIKSVLLEKSAYLVEDIVIFATLVGVPRVIVVVVVKDPSSILRLARPSHDEHRTYQPSP